MPAPDWRNRPRKRQHVKPLASDPISDEILKIMSTLPGKRKPGRPKRAHRLLAQALATGGLTIEATRNPDGSEREIRYIPASPDKLKAWAAGQYLTESAKQAIGQGVDLVKQTLAAGQELVPGVNPALALDKSLSPSMLKVAGYQDGPAASASLRIVNLIAPGQAAQAPPLIDLVREADIFAIPGEAGAGCSEEARATTLSEGGEGQ